MRFVNARAMDTDVHVPIPETWEHNRRYWTDRAFPGVVYRLDSPSPTFEWLPAQFLVSSPVDTQGRARRTLCNEDPDPPASAGCLQSPTPPRPQR